jgi:hypothetical protein
MHFIVLHFMPNVLLFNRHVLCLPDEQQSHEMMIVMVFVIGLSEA